MAPDYVSIAFKGFMLGYLHKEAKKRRYPDEPEDGTAHDKAFGAEEPWDDQPAAESKPAADQAPKEQPYNPAQGRYQSQDLDKKWGEDRLGELIFPDPENARETPYSYLGKELLDLAPGAGIGAATAGLGSLGLDALRGKPANIKRALLLSLLLGVPMGAAGQIGLQRGTRGFRRMGRAFAGAGDTALKDVLAGAGKLKDKGVEMAGGVVDKAVGAANKIRK